MDTKEFQLVAYSVDILLKGRAFMLDSFVGDSIISQWYYSNLAITATAVSLLLGIMVLALKERRIPSVYVVAAVFAPFFVTLPLCFDRLGFSSSSLGDTVMTWASFSGLLACAVLLIPFITSRLLRSTPHTLTRALSSMTGLGITNSNTVDTMIMNTELSEEDIHDEVTSLEFLGGERNGEQVSLPNKEITLGRSKDNDVVISDPTVSRYHAKISTVGADCVIEDLGSTSGTLVNNELVGKTVVHRGDRIKLGSTVVGLNGIPSELRNAPTVTLGYKDDLQFVEGVEAVDGDVTGGLTENWATYQWQDIPEVGSHSGPTGVTGAGLKYLSLLETSEFRSDEVPETNTSNLPVDIAKTGISPYHLGYISEPEINNREPQIKHVRQQEKENTMDTVVRRKTPLTNWWMNVNAQGVQGHGFQLYEGDHYIGRSKSNQIVVNDPYVSRVHGLIRVSGSDVKIFPQVSCTDIRVNQKLITGTQLSDNSVVALGETRLRLMTSESNPNMAIEADPDITWHEEPKRRKAVVLIQSGPDSGKTFDLAEGTSVIGRGDTCDIKLQDATVSRFHSVIHNTGDCVTIQDIGSKSGTLVEGTAANGILIDGVTLKGNDLISIGKSSLTILKTPGHNSDDTVPNSHTS